MSAKPHALEWQIKARHDFEYSGDSVNEIARRHGHSRTALDKLMKRDAALGDPWVRKNPQTNLGGRRRHDQQVPLSPQHLQIGAHLNFLRTVKNDWTSTVAGAKLSVSRAVIRNMELGFHDFTLSELNMISELVGLPVPELMFGKKEGG